MPSKTWLLDDTCARLELPELKATIDSKLPDRGLIALVAQGIDWKDARLLGVSGSALAAAAATRVEWHVRGDDLVAAYEIGPPDAARIDLSWHAATPDTGDPWFARIDLVVSVRTDRLDWRHDVHVEGDLRGAIARRDTPSCGGCAQFRADRWTYVEIVHPADLRCDELSTVANDPEGNLLRRRLFLPETLEKGVILRARTRGLFLPAAAAAETITKCYTDFVATDPPLGT